MKITPVIRFVLAMICFLAALCIATTYAQGVTNAPPVTSPPAIDLNIFESMIGQVINSPASLLVILAISIIAAVIEAVPKIPSALVLPFCVFGGSGFYWGLVPKTSVPATFPHPALVLILNGMILGFLAYAVHKGVIAKILAKVGATGGGTSLLVGSLAMPLLLSGCTTTGQVDIDRVASVAREASEFGTSVYVSSNPSSRPAFQVAQQQLQMLANSPSLGVTDLLNIIQRLPVQQLQSKNAQIAVEGGKILIAGINLPTVPADKLADLHKLAQALADGISAGLGNPVTPTPTPAPVPTTHLQLPIPVYSGPS